MINSPDKKKNIKITALKIINVIIYCMITALLVKYIFDAVLGNNHIITELILLGLMIVLLVIERFNRNETNHRIEKQLYNIIQYMDNANSDNQDEDWEDNENTDHLLNLDYLDIEEKIQNYIDKVRNLNILKRQAEYNAHQSQINPHFLYNTLDTIRGKAYESGQTDIADMIECLSRVFRYSLSNKKDMLRIQDEIDNAKDYISIQQMRFHNRFSFYCDVDENDWRLLQFQVPKLILQPLIENSITHGLDRVVKNGRVTLKAYRTKKHVIIRVEDNGCGISEEKLQLIIKALKKEVKSSDTDNKFGIALCNINQRIKYIYGSRYGLSISSIEGYGTTTEIVMPYTEV